jgi:uncharacterized protein (TIGR02246 family)
MPNPNATAEILARERYALDRWARGDPTGFAEVLAEDVSWMAASPGRGRVDGIEEVARYLETLKGRIAPHRYEVVDPRVQLYGEIGVLTLRYEEFALDGQRKTPWKATSVYRKTDGEWRLVHAHWSILQTADM